MVFPIMVGLEDDDEALYILIPAHYDQTRKGKDPGLLVVSPEYLREHALENTASQRRKLIR